MTNLTITQGDEKAYNLTFSTAGVAQDITGATVKMTVRRTRNSGEALISKVVTTHTDPTEGKTTITLSPTDTAIDLGWVCVSCNYFTDKSIAASFSSSDGHLNGRTCNVLSHASG